MPYKSSKIKLKGLQDRRRKLTDEQKAEIHRIYSSGFGSLTSLAKQFGVSKKTVLLIVNPASAEKQKQYIKDNWKNYSVDKEEHARVTREHRHYKQKLYLEGKLIDDKIDGKNE